tara:strand:- start:3548 stop:4375 length:828 start_codon:yes stop_codon:yes gene_type:complete
MKNNIIFCFFISILASNNIYAQSENYAKFYNKGNKFIENNFEEAEKNFRVAIDDSLSDLRASFNLSNKYYNEGLYDEAISRQIESTKLAKNKSEKHKAFHNLGNSLVKKDMCSEAVLAYKNALRNDPGDDETRYNLALAKKCEEEQEKNNDDENNDDQNKDDQQDKDDENKDDKNKDDQQDKGEDNKDDKNKDDQQDKDDKNKDNQNKDDQNKNDQKKENNKSEKPRENKNQQLKLSPQQIKNLLKAMENAEKKVQAKVNDNKQKGTKVVSEKDW